MENEMNDFKPSIDQVIELIASLSNSMRQLTLSALDLQALALSKKHQIEKKLDMVDDLGDTIDELIQFLMRLIPNYFNQYGSSEKRP